MGDVNVELDSPVEMMNVNKPLTKSWWRWMDLMETLVLLRLPLRIVWMFWIKPCSVQDVSIVRSQSIFLTLRDVHVSLESMLVENPWNPMSTWKPLLVVPPDSREHNW